MGIHSSLEGGFTLTPPIPLHKIPADSPHLAANHRPDPLGPPVDLVFAIAPDYDTDTAPAAEVAIGLDIAYEGGRKSGRLVGEIEELLAAYGTAHIFTGEVIEHDEDGGVTYYQVRYDPNGPVVSMEEEDPEDGEAEEDEGCEEHRSRIVRLHAA
ncbi:hypothetical protein AB0J63_20955 [Streptosporangium canum]|uniref:hypothetical protein n=1 Tax=Streptosporangium canum TaxID=324952 RepID=UPI00343CE35D